MADECFIVVRVSITGVVGRRACETWHGAELEREDGLVVDQSLVHNLLVGLVPSPNLSVAERWFACRGGLEVLHLGQLEWQALLRQHVGHTILVIDGEGLAPVALAAEDSVAQTIVDLHTAQALAGDVLLHGLDGVLDAETVEAEFGVRRVLHDAFLGIERTLIEVIVAFDERDDGEVEVLGKSPVA